MKSGWLEGRWGAGRRKPAESEARLNITSMMDMFTIMLIFLLLNFAPDSADLKVGKDLTLPSSSSERPYEVSVKIALTRSELLVGDDVVGRVRNGKLLAPRPERLQRALQVQRDRIADAEKAIVVFYADEATPFETVEAVMTAAAAAGFPNFKFAVQGGS